MSLIYEKKETIAYITLNRPEAHNALDPGTIVELAEAWEDYRDDKTLRCAIITGTGDKSFCSGGDLGKMIPLTTGARKPENEADEKVFKDPMLVHRAILRNFELYKPVIAAVNGHAIGGGLEILYSTDIRVASRDAKFGLPEAKWAILPAGGSTARLPMQLPYARAMELLLTGELMDAQEAYRMGLLNRVVPREKVMEEAERFAHVISKNGPFAVSAIKKSVLSSIGLTLEDGLANEWEFAASVFMSNDAKEGPRAFMEKREPRFTGT